MRVLRTEGSDSEHWIPRLCTHNGQPYAILSHRWLEDANHEVLFTDIQEIDKTVISTPEYYHVKSIKNAQYVDDSAKTKPGFKKIHAAARQALRNGLEYVWIDTCCIDKSSSSELAEAINSMFKWYKASEICYAYLMDVEDATDTSKDSAFAASQWWKRGWTLQELLAPPRLTFFASNWAVVGQRDILGTAISSITGISSEVLEDRRNIPFCSIAERMSWASNRTTTRPEDLAYCLMGLFDVNMPILYGEGEKAFIRLQQEIIKDSDDESIFAWRDEPSVKKYSGMLATRPAAFAGSRNVDLIFATSHRPPYSMTNKGLSITLPLSPINKEEEVYMALLRCTTSEDAGTCVGIFLKKVSSQGEYYVRDQSRYWIEKAPSTYAEVTAIYVRQSWDGLFGFWTLLQMGMPNTDNNDHSEPLCSSASSLGANRYDDQTRPEVSFPGRQFSGYGRHNQ